MGDFDSEIQDDWPLQADMKAQKVSIYRLERYNLVPFRLHV